MKIPAQVLQSGFLCLTDAGLVTPPAPNPTITHSILQTHRHPRTEYKYAQELDRLFKVYLDNSQIIRQFDFRQAYLKEIIRVFGTLSFKNWVYAQTESILMTTANLEFLIDTLQYIMTGHRSLDPMNWVPMVAAAETDIQNPSTKTLELLECFFGDRVNRYLYDSTTTLPPGLLDVIQLWGSQVDGMKDIIITTGIIFGNQTALTMR